MAEAISQLPADFFKLPNELIDQIVYELPDRSLGNLRLANNRLYCITLGAWEKRALEDKDGNPALEWAVENNKLSLLHYLLQKFPDREINIPQGKRNTNPLCIACELGMTEVANALISHGADVNYVPSGRSALIQAIRGGHDTTVQMLLERNADPHARDFGNSNIVQVAARLNHVQTLRVILDRMGTHPEFIPGINDQNAQGLTALQLACGAGAVGAAELLLESGADIDRTCEALRFETPLTRAIRVSSFRRIEMATLLLSRGANIEGRMAETLTILNFDTPLHVAIQRRLPDSDDLVSLLISRGAALNVLDQAGFPTLHAALLGNRGLRKMRLIVDGGGDINMVDGEGSSALHHLASWPIREVPREAIRFFQENHADMSLVNNAGMRPCDLATLSGWDREAIEATWGTGA